MARVYREDYYLPDEGRPLYEYDRQHDSKPAIVATGYDPEAMTAERAAALDALDAQDIADADAMSVAERRAGRDWDLVLRALQCMSEYLPIETIGELTLATNDHFRPRVVRHA